MGTSSTKVVVLNDKKEAVVLFSQATGWSAVDVADNIGERLRMEGFYPAKCACVSTGLGRSAIPFAKRTVEEPVCAALGAVWLYNNPDLLVIDIGARGTRLINVAGGKMVEIAANNKCAAGTGRFLEMMASALALRPSELCRISAEGEAQVLRSSCAVFAETEVAQMLASGINKADISRGVVQALVEKVAAQTHSLEQQAEQACLIGGLCNCPAFCEILSQRLQQPILVNRQAQYALAIGAAVSAYEESHCDDSVL